MGIGLGDLWTETGDETTLILIEGKYIIMLFLRVSVKKHAIGWPGKLRATYAIICKFDTVLYDQ